LTILRKQNHENQSNVSNCNSSGMISRTITRNLLRSNRILRNRQVDHAVCIDIECTCDSPVQIRPMEIIEIACLKLDLVTPKQENNSPKNESFHSFVRPVINPKLTLFCQELTGVTQSIVDRSQTIEVVIDELLEWLSGQQLIDSQLNSRENFAFASCGNFDLNLLSPLVEAHRFNDKELPNYFREWINVKKTFVTHKGQWPRGLYHMLEILGEEPFGRLHSAIDDCSNLAKVVQSLQSEGCTFHLTSRLSETNQTAV